MATPVSSPRNATTATEIPVIIQPPAGLEQEEGGREELPQVPSIESSPGFIKPVRIPMTPGADEDKIQELETKIKKLEEDINNFRKMVRIWLGNQTE